MKKLLWMCLCLVFLMMEKANVVSADMGPKPSVVMEIRGLEEENYYVTLITDVDEIGPWSRSQKNCETDVEEKVWEKFWGYIDEDAYHFLGYFEECSDDDKFEWTYYPPERFKILFYFPDTDRLVGTEKVYERYAFASYFTVDVVDLEHIQVTASKDEILVEQSYEYGEEIVGLVVRIVLTIGIEVLIAWMFFYRKKKELLVIGKTNVVTQGILNVLLNVACYKGGPMLLGFSYILLELLVFGIEGAVYQKKLGEVVDGKRRKGCPWGYALVANAVSFGIGVLLAKMVPAWF